MRQTNTSNRAVQCFRIGCRTASVFALLWSFGCSLMDPAGVDFIRREASSFNGVVISWSPVEGADEYQIYRSRSEDGKYVKVAQQKEVRFQDCGLPHSTDIFYKVRSVKKSPDAKSQFTEPEMISTDDPCECINWTKESSEITCDKPRLPGLLASCRPDWTMLQSLKGVVSGQEVAEAADYEYQEGVEDVHPVVVLNLNGNFDTLTFCMPEEWTPSTIGETELVAGHQSGTSHLETCQYEDGFALARYQHWEQVMLRVARTGEVLIDETVYGSMPDECPPSISVLGNRGYTIESSGSTPDLENLLLSYVESHEPRGIGGPDGEVETDSDTSDEMATDAEMEVDCDGPLRFADPVLEGVVREAIGIATGDFYATDASGLTALSATDLDDGISDLTGIQCLTDLTVLNLDGNDLRDLTPLTDMIQLTELYLRRNPVQDIAPLAGLINLTVLHVKGDNVHDLSPLTSLTQLTILDLSNVTSLSFGDEDDLSPLAGLTQLTQLALNDREFVDITPLAGLINLTELDLGNASKLSDINTLASLINLTDLNLSSMDATDINVLANMTKLVSLDLSFTDVSDITPLAGLLSMTHLDLGFCEIADIAPLAGLVNLVELNLQYNDISDISPLAENAGIGEGDEVNITDNPVDDCNDPNIAVLEARGVTLIYECDAE